MTLGCGLAVSGPAKSQAKQIEMGNSVFIFFGSEEFTKLLKVSWYGYVGILRSLVLEDASVQVKKDLSKFGIQAFMANRGLDIAFGQLLHASPRPEDP